MRLFGLNISRARRSAPTEHPISQLSPQALAWLRGEDSPSSDSPHLANAYEQVVWVYRAINVIAEQIANIPFLFSRGQRGRESLITSGPLLDFYSHPHPSLNSFQYWELRVLWLLLRGESMRVPIFQDSTALQTLASGGWVYPELAPDARHKSSSSFSSSPEIENRKSKIKNILLLDPSHFQHIIENHQLLGWRYTAAPNAPLESQVFLPEDIWFERL